MKVTQNLELKNTIFSLRSRNIFAILTEHIPENEMNELIAEIQDVLIHKNNFRYSTTVVFNDISYTGKYEARKLDRFIKHPQPIDEIAATFADAITRIHDVNVFKPEKKKESDNIASLQDVFKTILNDILENTPKDTPKDTPFKEWVELFKQTKIDFDTMMTPPEPEAKPEPKKEEPTAEQQKCVEYLQFYSVLSKIKLHGSKIKAKRKDWDGIYISKNPRYGELVLVTERNTIPYTPTNKDLFANDWILLEDK